MSSERSPELIEIIRRAIEARLLDVHTAIPARVVAYNATSQRADCKPVVMRAYLDEEEQRKVESMPVIPACPVQFPGGGGLRITFPISDGSLVIDGQTVPATLGLLVFAEASLDKWLSGTGGEVDPEIDDAHGLADAIFFPGLHTFGSPLASCPPDHATMGADTGVQIHFRGATITIGTEAGSKAIGLHLDAVTADTTMAAWIAAAQTLLTALALATGGVAPVAPSDFGRLQATATQAKAK